MKTRYISLLLAVLGLATTLAQAQTQTQIKESKEGISTEQQLAEQLGTDQLVSLPANSANRAVLTQDGNNNSANIDQRLFGGAGNTAAVLQLGNVNTANVTQMGSGNVTSVKQTGNRNRVNTDIEGYNTESNIVQTGNNNQVNQDLNVDSRRYKVEQQGNNNQLNQRESGSTAPPGYEIRMQGSGINLTIEQGKVHP
jgi:hypothetical protein